MARPRKEKPPEIRREPSHLIEPSRYAPAEIRRLAAERGVGTRKHINPEVSAGFVRSGIVPLQIFG